MTNSARLPKLLLTFGIVLPLAALLGYLLATPQDFLTIATVALVVGVMTIPIFLRWHQPILVFSWNAGISLSFLPGNPYLWVPVAMISFCLTVLNSILHKEAALQQVKSVTWSLVALALVVIVTAKLNGGLGIRAFGGSVYGGRKYYLILFAVMGYFALSSQRIPLEKARLYGGLFTLSAATSALSNIVYFFPTLWFLYLILPVDHALSQAAEDFQSGLGGAQFSRLGGVAWTALACFYFMLSRYGVRGILDWSKPWRGAVTILLVGFGLLGGFRTIMILYVLAFVLQYCLEGLLRTRTTVVLLVCGVLGASLLVPFAYKLPPSVQRSLSVFPVKISPEVRMDAQNSSDWRVRMWSVLVPEISKYLILGKGYTASAADYYLAYESFRRGFGADFETSLVAGDYHSGPLSILIPFGIWGVLAFSAFSIAGVRVLFLNWKFGNPVLKVLNTFLLATFLARLIVFYFVFGAVHADLAMLVGLVGMSVSLNGGVSCSTNVCPPTESTLPLSIPSVRS